MFYKFLHILALSFFNFVQAKINVHMTLQENFKKNEVLIEKKVSVQHGQKKVFEAANGTRRIEMVVNDHLPKMIHQTSRRKLIVYDIKIFKIDANGTEELLATPQLISPLGKEVSMTSESDDGHSLKVQLMSSN